MIAISILRRTRFIPKQSIRALSSATDSLLIDIDEERAIAISERFTTYHGYVHLIFFHTYMVCLLIFTKYLLNTIDTFQKFFHKPFCF